MYPANERSPVTCSICLWKRVSTGLACLAAILGSLLVTSQTALSDPITAAKMDWVDTPAVTENNQTRTRMLCNGGYQQPAWLFDPTLVDSADEPVKASALSAEFVEQGTTVLLGKVIVRQGTSELRAERVELGENRELAASLHLQIPFPQEYYYRLHKAENL